jgi:hypothetical protein
VRLIVIGIAILVTIIVVVFATRSETPEKRRRGDHSRRRIVQGSKEQRTSGPCGRIPVVSGADAPGTRSILSEYAGLLA